MKILIVGGRGLIGVVAARHLASLGHEVTISSRRATTAAEGAFPTIVGDYVERSFTIAQLAPFDAIVFSAGQDVRHAEGQALDDAFWRAVQIEGVPAFARLAREAGVPRFVQIGSYYHVVMPELAGTDVYVRARQLADEGARALADRTFNISTLNPPSIVGAIRGPSLDRYRNLIAWARGERPQIPDFSPTGGTNYMSARALAQAIAGALERAAPGRAYLVGDENLTFQAFFQRIFDAAGSDRRLETRNAPHSMLPDNFIIHGRGVTLAFEPDAADVALLGYERGDVDAAIKEIVAMADA